ncbi:MAG: glycosyltransferase family 4 protein [Bacteroidales bacterium]|nr:glycosyltransferase family 4 protein [Bacteroidales bacterium]
MKKFWIVNYYSCPPEYTANPRHLEFSNYLNKAGYDVTTISAGYLSDKKIDLVPDNRKYSKVEYGEHKFIHIKVKHFVGNGIDRMLSIFQFAWRLFRYSKNFEKPDIILHNIHAPFDYPVLWCAKKFKAKYVVEAWDLWPESFVRFGLISKNNPIVKFAYCIERRLYEKADRIIFSFEGGLNYLKEQCWTKESGGKIDTKKVFYINNGVNLKKFNADIEQNQLHDKDLEDTTHFKVIYLGAVRLINNIKQLIDAAKILKTNSKIKFLIYGDGSDRAYLEKYCKENEIENVIFKEKWIPLRNVPYVLSKSSLNILNYQQGFGNYGVSSGKLFQYLASGKPICANVKMNYCLIEKNKLGVAKNLETPQEYADAILSIALMDESSYNAICKRVKEVAEEFDYKLLSEKLIYILELNL